MLFLRGVETPGILAFSVEGKPRASHYHAGERMTGQSGNAAEPAKQRRMVFRHGYQLIFESRLIVKFVRPAAGVRERSAGRYFFYILCVACASAHVGIFYCVRAGDIRGLTRFRAVPPVGGDRPGARAPGVEVEWLRA